MGRREFPRSGILANMPEEQRRLVKTWLSFYHAHKEDLRHGQMTPVQDDPGFSTSRSSGGEGVRHVWEIPDSDGAAAARGPGDLPVQLHQPAIGLYIILRNLEGEFTCEVYDRFLRLVAKPSQFLHRDQALPFSRSKSPACS
jgi:hypothetical protein